MLAILQGDVDAADSAVHESLGIARRAGLRKAEAQALSLLGFISIFAQDPSRAKPILHESLTMARDAGDVAAAMSTLLLLGRAHLYLSEVRDARSVFEECMLLLSAPQAHRARFGLAWAALAAGDERQAGNQFEQTLPMLIHAGEHFETALTLSFLGELGELAWARGDAATARTRLDEGLELANAMGAPFPLVRCLSVLAELAQADERNDEAARLIGDACRVSEGAGLRYAFVRCVNLRARHRSAAGEGGTARADYRFALSLARANGDAAGAAQSLTASPKQSERGTRTMTPKCCCTRPCTCRPKLETQESPLR
jgi:tetratricopeptide (TPR) repeat protein